MLACGVDMIAVARMAAAVERKGERFLRRVFTEAERRQCGGPQSSLAARWAAKEATAKALGSGIGDVAWREIEVLSDARGAPVLHLHGAAGRLAEARGLTAWAVSLTHDDGVAMAFVVAMRAVVASGGNDQQDTIEE